VNEGIGGDFRHSLNVFDSQKKKSLKRFIHSALTFTIAARLKKTYFSLKSPSVLDVKSMVLIHRSHSSPSTRSGIYECSTYCMKRRLWLQDENRDSLCSDDECQCNQAAWLHFRR